MSNYFNSIFRIIIISCVSNVVIQMVYDIYKYATSLKNHNCDIKIQGSLFWTEFLWFFSRSNSCIFWMIPFLYIFVPSSFFKKLCNKKSIIENLDSDSNESMDDPITQNGQQYM